MIKITREEALEYHHLGGRPGKISVVPSKPLDSQRDLSLAYTPGVAEPVLEIERDAGLAYEYTSKGNLVAVISNGTAILGLGDRGALASKPVMEGKGVLFKKFAGIDVFDIEVDAHDPETVIQVVSAIAPTFGGINLEDIKSPECFYIEERLKARLDIPVFHDDQHGTAIILGAALLNGLELTGKKIDEIKVVFSGAGAAAIACARQLVKLGTPRRNIWMCDVAGLVYGGREAEMFPEKAAFAQGDCACSLRETMAGADVFIGLSVANLVDEDMIRSMAERPMVFAMANPNPEIAYDRACGARCDAIIATGRSDTPNQINNVLGFPGIFRGALDVRARAINDEMKLAASYALAALAKEPVPGGVLEAYGLSELAFGDDYVVPKPLDPRVVAWVAPAVARAAMESGAARKMVDLEKYGDAVRERISQA
ncbi:MAG TPA: malic enzyme-like NAD(P)-binding protein [Anaerolineaceae bacterium]|jgi:malate dehydrogenase (oxaloacetate-decarboxylating)(NADP+)